MIWAETPNTSESERLIEFAGRICYLAFGERQHTSSNKEYIAKLVRQRHESVLEHSSATLLVTNISRSLSHQLVRHRAGFSYSQLSQQYVEESDATFATPRPFAGTDDLASIWQESIDASKAAYIKLINAMEAAGVGADLSAREKARLRRSVARSVLPEATHTILVMTGNVRAWRNLLAARGDIAGDLEMTEFCVKALEQLRTFAPDCFPEYVVKSRADGREYVAIDGTRLS